MTRTRCSALCPESHARYTTIRYVVITLSIAATALGNVSVRWSREPLLIGTGGRYMHRNRPTLELLALHCITMRCTFRNLRPKDVCAPKRATHVKAAKCDDPNSMHSALPGIPCEVHHYTICSDHVVNSGDCAGQRERALVARAIVDVGTGGTCRRRNRPQRGIGAL